MSVFRASSTHDGTDHDLDVGSVCVPSPGAQAPADSVSPSDEQIEARLLQAGFNPPVNGYVAPPELRPAWIIAGSVGALVALLIAVAISYHQATMYPAPPPASAAAQAEGSTLPKPSSPSIYDKPPSVVTVDVTGDIASARATGPSSASSAEVTSKKADGARSSSSTSAASSASK